MTFDGGAEEASDEVLAESGDREAMHRLAWSLYESDPDRSRSGTGSWPIWATWTRCPPWGALLEDRNRNEAQTWLVHAADAGDAKAMYRLGVKFWNDDPVGAQNSAGETGRAWRPHAMYALGYHLKARNSCEALEWWKRAAELDDTKALHSLGRHYRLSDPKRARRYWTRAANLGNTSAMVGLAWLLDPYRVGSFLHDVKRREAEVWLTKAVEAGSPDALLMKAKFDTGRDRGVAECPWPSAEKSTTCSNGQPAWARSTP